MHYILTAVKLIQSLSVCLFVFSEEENVQRQIVIEDVEENISEKGVDSDFLPNMVRRVWLDFDREEKYNIYCPQSHKHSQLSQFIFLFRLLGCGLDYVHSRAGSSYVEHSLTFPGNVHSSACIPYVYVCLWRHFPFGITLR